MRSGERGGPRSCREGGQVLGEAKQTAGQKACGVSTPQRMWKSDVGQDREKAAGGRDRSGGSAVEGGWSWCVAAGKRAGLGSATSRADGYVQGRQGGGLGARGWRA